MITIVIPAYNELECTRQCIESILAHTDCAYRVVLVDNGSAPPLAPFFERAPGVTVLRSEKNLGFAAGVNLGIAEAEGHVLLLNNDTIVPQGWLTRLQAVLLSAPDIGMVGPMSNYTAGSQLIPFLTLHTMEEIDALAKARREEFGDTIRDVPRLVGFCLLIRDTVIAEVGPLDERYGIGNYEDDDYCVRVLRAGYRLVVDEASFVFHYGHKTFQAIGMQESEWKKLLEENAAKFGAKWKFDADEKFEHFRAAMRLNKAAGQSLAQGDLALALRGYRDALLLAPHVARNYNDLGVALWHVGVEEEALEHIKKALELEPDYEEARENLAEMGRALDRTREIGQFLAELPETRTT